ncbi:hypothetical protein [Vreelandella titanicae]|uniref:Uncharacterized protein n=1 Tax=Vreelandella titanicae TaxID=664683 RepID=A0A558J7P7_9GAMM|nr:hypothetical protein [Halomonas titanicae]TVU89665.1 hypothetical protein FQP89_09915 [Halomonas titanicae]
MKREFDLKLKDFPTIPNSLRKNATKNFAKSSVDIDIARLFHHYYIDKHGKCPPSPDLSQFEPAMFLTNENAFRFSGSGFGNYPAAKQAGSNQLGQALFRWFLHDHCGITYFAHMHNCLNRSVHRGFGQIKINRVDDGDVPDYLCAKNTNQICIGEAKGRYRSIGFRTKEFDNWRNQFNRIEVVDKGGAKISVKGYIIGSRFATEKSPRVRSTIFAEDPATPGERGLSEMESDFIRKGIVSLHYARIVEKMNMPLLAAALESGSQISDELRPRATVWEFQLGIDNLPKRYVGGYWPKANGFLPFRIENGKPVHNPSDPFRLDSEDPTFIGIEESIFKQVAALARSNDNAGINVSQYPDPGPFYSAISTLRDGSIVAPSEFFIPVDVVEY